MNVPTFIHKTAWFPLTPRGVAAFAAAKSGRLFLVQFCFALMAALTIGWFARIGIAPTIRDAINSLPVDSSISGGKLVWPANAPEPVMLAEGPFVSFAVDLDQRGVITTGADVQVQLGRTDWQLTSIFGVLDAPALVDTSYPSGYIVTLNRNDLGPWWGAREPFLFAGLMALSVIYLMASWLVLSVLYTPIVMLVVFYSNRFASIAGCWRLAGAALMPGAVFMTAALVFYGLGAFDLLRLALAAAMHFVVGWYYLIASALCLPRHPKVLSPGQNPFTTSAGE